MVDPIPPEVKRVWKKWNIRGTILFSLSLQTFLVLLAPYRKSTRKKLLIMLIWSGYLLADAAANFTVGLISNSQGDDSGSQSNDANANLLAFWAPFLLVHLGGPDTITAFALEDNELWLRHLLGLGFQAVAAVYVFIQSIPNRLTVPTILMFVAGIIKYIERTRALYLASLDRFRDSMLKEPDPGPNYAKLMEELAFKKENKLPTTITMITGLDQEARATDVPVKKGPLNNLEVVHYAYKYFLIFKGLIVDLIFSFRERDESRDFFRVRSAVDALRVIEVELNFMYEVLYTKVQVVHSIWGYIFRSIALGSIIASLVLFHFNIKKHGFSPFDVGITYTLLWGAVVLDFIALLMLIFSDWTFASIKDPDSNKGIFAKIFKAFLQCRCPIWRNRDCTISGERNYNIKVERKHKVLATPIVFRRWSGSLASYNLISYCLKNNPSRIHKFTRWPVVFAKKIAGFLHIKCCDRFVDCLAGAAKKAVDGVMFAVEFVFGTMKNMIVDGIKSAVKHLMRVPGLHRIMAKIEEAFIHLHDFIMGSMGINDFLDELLYVYREPFTKELWEFIFDELRTKAGYGDDPETAKRISSARGEWVLTDTDSGDCSTLLPYVTDVQYDESLLLWHIATDLCYYTKGEKPVDDGSFDYREFSKLLSDYMLYLLIMQPTMMSAVGGIGKIRFRDTCEEAKRLFERRNLLVPAMKKPTESREEKASDAILSVTKNTNVKPVDVKGDRSKSVLFDASLLAKELNFLEKKKGLNKWKTMSRVWVELMSYAASHCRANAHAQQVSKGGELVTFIWLLMAHFGLGEQFQINEGHARAKLIVGK